MGSGLEDRFQNLHEIVKAAKMSLPQGPWDYLVGGTETETTLRRNRQAIDSIAFRPRVLRNVATVDLTTTFLGRKLRLPKSPREEKSASPPISTLRSRLLYLAIKPP